MNQPPFDTVGDAPVEARIVAWVLGEASAFEAAELERLCEERPELLVFRRRMRSLHGLLTEAEAAEPDQSWKLPTEKRKILDEIFGEEKVTHLEPRLEKSVSRSARRALLGIAACLVLTLIIAGLLASGGAGIQKARKSSDLRQSERKADFLPASEKQDSALALQELNEAVRDQEDKVEERRKVLSTLVRTKGIIYKGQDSFYSQSEVAEDHSSPRAGPQDINELEQEKMQLDSQIASLEKYGKDQLMTYAAGLNLPDNVVKNLLPEYSEAKRNLETLKIEGLGEDHPAVVAQADQIKSMKSQLDEGVVNLRATLQAQREMTDERLKQVEIMKDDSREESIKRGLDAQDYVDAKRDFEADQRLLQALKLKQIEQTVALKVADRRLARNNASASAFTSSAPLSDGTYRIESNSMSSNQELGMQKTKEQSMLAKSPAKPASPVSASAALEQSQLLPPTDSSVMDQLPAIAGSGLGRASGLGGESKLWSDSSAMESDAFAPPAVLAKDEMLFSSFDESVKRSHIDANSNSRFGRREVGRDATESRVHDRASNDHTRAELLSQVVSTWEIPVPAADSAPVDTPVPSGAAKIEVTREVQYPMEYEPPAPAIDLLLAEDTKLLADLTNEIPAAETPYSTFSLNISDASFQLAKASLAKGERPDPASIKPEQFYNAVDYGDPAPTSNEPVAATIEQSAHPVIPGRNLVRVALRTGSVGRSAVQPLRLTLLVDQSGSMVREDRRASMEHALAQLGVLLTKDDLVTVIGFSRTPHLLADGMSGDQATNLSELVNQTASEGGTNLEEAMKLGGQLAERHQLAGAQNRIVLFTDGAANLGDANPARLAEQVKAFRQNGLAFDIAGIGADGLNDRLLSELARNGNGRYYVVGNEKDDSFARQLAGAFRPAAENVKVQVNFNPQRVGKYKLIGFEKDRLKTEDFRNDAVDAAELAAEEAGVAIYQVETLPEGTGELGEVSVRFRDMKSGEMVERTWSMPYDAQATAFDRATPSMQLAGLSMLAAEKLRGGPLADAIDFNQLTGPGAFVKQFYGSSPRVADMLRVIDALK